MTSGHWIGKITDDAEKLSMNAYSGNVLWTGPLQILFVLIYLLWDFGFYSMLGFLIAIPFCFVQLYLATKVKYYNDLKKQEYAKRNTIITELLSSIRVVKMYCWEKPLGKLIDSVRKKEMHYGWKKFVCYILLFDLHLLASKLIVAICLLIYYYLGYELRADKIFPLMLLMNYILVLMLKRLPWAIKDTSYFISAANNLEETLLLDNNNKELIKNSKPPFRYDKQKGQEEKKPTKFNKSVITLKGANASWDCVSLLGLTRPKLNSNRYLLNFRRHPPLTTLIWK